MRVITFLKSVAKCVVTTLAIAMVFTKSNGLTLGIKKVKILEIEGCVDAFTSLMGCVGDGEEGVWVL